MIIRLLLPLFFWIFTLKLQAQSNLYENIQNRLDTIYKAPQKIKLLIEAGDYYLERDLYKAENYYRKAEKLIDKDDIQNKAIILKNLGSVYYRKSDYSEGLSYYLKSKTLYEKLKDTANIGVLLLKEGMTYKYLEENKRAIKNYNESLKLAINIKDSTLIGRCYIAIGGSYKRMNEIDSSSLYYHKALKLFRKINNELKISNVRNDLAVLYGMENQFDKALAIHLKNLDFIKQNHSKTNVSTTYFNISFSCYKLKQYDQALKYLDSSHIIAKKEGFKYRLSRIAVQRSRVYAKKKQYQKAYVNHVLYKRYSDSIFNLKKQKQIRELQLQHDFDNEKKELEIIAHKKELKSRLYGLLIVLILFFAVIIGYLVWRDRIAHNKIMEDQFEKERLKKEVLSEKVKTSESELKNLIADNSMRLEFIKQLSKQIKKDKLSTGCKNVQDYANTLLFKLQQQIGTENKLSVLKDKINEVNQGFDTEIIQRFPSLTKTEREVCALLRLNLSIKEIASIRNSSIDSIKALRYRIRKKL